MHPVFLLPPLSPLYDTLYDLSYPYEMVQIASLLLLAATVLAVPRPQSIPTDVPACVSLCVRVKYEEQPSLAPACAGPTDLLVAIHFSNFSLA